MFLYKFMQRFPGWYAAGVEPDKIFGHTAARHLSSPIANCYKPGIFGRRFELITLDSGAGACRKSRDAARGCEGRSCSGRARLYRDAQRRRFLGGAAGPRPLRGASSVLFSLNSMRNLCACAGFVVLECGVSRTRRNKMDLRALCRHDPGACSAPLLHDDVAQALKQRKAFLAVG